MVHALQKGELSPSDVSAKVKDVADRIGDEDAEDFASTKHSGKPEKVAKETLRKLRDVIRTELESCGYTHTVDGDKLKSPGGTGPEDREHKVDEDVDEGFGSEDTLDAKGIKEFEQWRKDNAEQLGYTLSGTPDVKEERDYKAEYKKFQSSTKAKKYRAELNQYNRKKGTYGNGDGKDASHKGGKIVGFETQSKNRGRAEKSRLKQERASVGDVGLGFLIDQLINSMEHYQEGGGERAFAKHMKKELDLKPQDSKKLWKLYWKLPPRKRMRMWPQEWEKVLKRIGITESVSINESAVSFWQDMFRPGPIPKKYITQLIKKRGELPSKKHIKKIYRDNGNPTSTQLAKTWKQLTKEKYVRAASGLWRWNTGFTGWESVNEVITVLTEGYSNYWKHTEDFTPQEWSKIVRLTKTVIKRAERGGIVIRGGFGKGNPKINNKEIWLNGDGKEDLDHETFYITKKVKGDWSFTKTARKPYDAVVASILLGIQKIAPKKFSAKADGKLKMGGVNNWKTESVNEARTINVEPNWEGVWRYFKHIEKTSPSQWRKMKGSFRDSWIKLQKMADKKGWKTESVNEGMKAFRAYRKMKEGIEDIITGIRILRGHIDDAPYNKGFSLMTSELYKLQLDLEKKLHKFIPQIAKISKNKLLEAVEPSVKAQIKVLGKRLTHLHRANTNLELSVLEAAMQLQKIYNMSKDGKYYEPGAFTQLSKTLEFDHRRFIKTKFNPQLEKIITSTKSAVKALKLKESVNEAVPSWYKDGAKLVRKVMKKHRIKPISGGGSMSSWGRIAQKIPDGQEFAYSIKPNYEFAELYRSDRDQKSKKIAILAKKIVKDIKKAGMGASFDGDFSINYSSQDIAESVNERISVSDERYFGKKGIIIMIDVNGKKVSAIFKDKKNANKFNRNKPADIKKLLQLAKKTKYPKAIDESVNEDIGIDTYLGGIVQSLRKAGIRAKTAKQMKRGFSKSKDKIGFFIDVEQRTFGKKEMYTLQVEVDKDGNLWYLSGHRPIKLGKWADKSKMVRMWKALNKARGFGQAGIFQKKESVNESKRCTVKEVSKWLKTLEEFRYRKVRPVDARRVASFVNRGMNEEDLPMSLRKKWEHRKYGRERHLAEKYLAIITKEKS